MYMYVAVFNVNHLHTTTRGRWSVTGLKPLYCVSAVGLACYLQHLEVKLQLLCNVVLMEAMPHHGV